MKLLRLMCLVLLTWAVQAGVASEDSLDVARLLPASADLIRIV